MKRFYHKDGTLPTDNRIFVFGSNLAGIHGAGAALTAREKFGAELGVGVGLTGNSYAIPTKDWHINTMSMDLIKLYIKQFVTFSAIYSDCATRTILPDYPLFFVTRVGCGLAGFKDKDIAPMFKMACGCSFAEEWRQYLEV